MDFRSLARSVNFAVLGVDATVTVEGEDPVLTKVIWIGEVTRQEPRVDLSYAEAKKVIAIRRDEVPTVPRGTRVTVAEPTQGVSSWVVDEMDSVYPDHYRVAVLPDREGS